MDILTLCFDLNLECSSAFFSQDTLAYDFYCNQGQGHSEESTCQCPDGIF